MLDEQSMIEAKIYSGNLYGTSVSEIQAAKNENKVAMTDIEVQGVAEYKSLDPKVMAVFMLPPDFDTWQKRLSRRYGDVVDATDFRMRLQTALSELDQLLITDYYIPVVNNNLDKALQRVKDISDGKPLDQAEVKKAHDVAQKLARDIQKHLDDSSTTK
jgi:guanylate kinase